MRSREPSPVTPEIAHLALPVPWLGSVNLWLLKGEPLTLVDTGPVSDQALAALEEQLGHHRLRVEDVELVLVTHHHLDHSGLARTIKERSGAEIAAHRGTARWGAEYQDRVAHERRFTRELMAAHGVPQPLIEASKPFFDYIVHGGSEFATDRILSDGDTIRAGGRMLRVVFRPGHSATDTLFVDDATDDAFVGDHLLANITSGAELVQTELPGDERRRALLDYLSNLRKTEAMQLRTCYSGHGPTISDHRDLIGQRLVFHSNRLDLIARHVDAGCSTVFDIARRLWSDEVAETQPVLVVWEVLGHVDILVNRGTVREQVDDDGTHHFRPRRRAGVAAPG
jgi:glyoxylase-like metal-dependent hydrolase (beta-lactamase superfamily II)